MPELPEVETTIRYLRPHVVGQVIAGLYATNGGESQLSVPLSEFGAAAGGAKIASLERLGKWLIFATDKFDIVGHLRMSGRWLVDDKVLPHPHNRIQIQLENGVVLNFIDQRRFGTLNFVPNAAEYLEDKRLGPDALDPNIDSAQILTKLAKLKKPIYSALLDQSVIAGLGNIYVNEILHAAGIHPLTPSNQISAAQLESTLLHMHRILAQALALKGTTLIDNLYQDPEGKSGEFAQMLKVYGRKHDPDITVLKVGNRSVFVHKDTKLT